MPTWGGIWEGPWGWSTGGLVPVLSLRDRRFLTHRCDIWEPAFPLPAGGDPSSTTWARRLTGQRCHFTKKSSVDYPMIAALMESEDLITVDKVYLLSGTALNSSWLIVDRTLEPDGTQSDNYGQAYICRGEPMRRASAPGRPCGRVIAYVTKLELLPEGVTV